MTSPFWVEPPPEPSGDILSEERESRLQRRRRGVRAFLPGNWVRGRPALVLLVGLLVGGLGWFGFNYWENGPSANSRYGPVSDSRSGHLPAPGAGAWSYVVGILLRCPVREAPLRQSCRRSGDPGSLHRPGARGDALRDGF